MPREAVLRNPEAGGKGNLQIIDYLVLIQLYKNNRSRSPPWLGWISNSLLQILIGSLYVFCTTDIGN
jgi:hypothetical protein